MASSAAARIEIDYPVDVVRGPTTDGTVKGTPAKQRHHLVDGICTTCNPPSS